MVVVVGKLKSQRDYRRHPYRPCMTCAAAVEVAAAEVAVVLVERLMYRSTLTRAGAIVATAKAAAAAAAKASEGVVVTAAATAAVVTSGRPRQTRQRQRQRQLRMSKKTTTL
jgi:hypothetical protein